MSDAVVVVQARAGSTRLPGKVLLDVGGRSMLDLMLRRLAPLADAGLPIVVATSALDRDDPVAEAAAAAGAAVVRGDEADVLGRFLLALDRFPADAVVRLTADCPLIDPAIVAATLDLHRRSGAAYTSNTLVRTFPDGLDVEVAVPTALREAAAAPDADGAEREHVTPYLYRRPATHLLAQHCGAEPLGHERWTVDTAEDLDVVRRAVAACSDPLTAPWGELLDVLGRREVPPGLHAVPDTTIVHQPGRPFVRRWHLAEAGAPAGSATVTVDDGVGTPTLDVAPGREADALALVRTLLAADAQVRRLLSPTPERLP